MSTSVKFNFNDFQFIDSMKLSKTSLTYYFGEFQYTIENFWLLFTFKSKLGPCNTAINDGQKNISLLSFMSIFSRQILK